MGATIHLDTEAANKALDALIEKAQQIHATATTKPDPAAVAQALRRHQRRNGTT